MTERIYNGHIRRYERWCFKENFDAYSMETLKEYKKYLTDEKKLSNSYVNGILNVLCKKWFSIVLSRSKKIQSKSKKQFKKPHRIFTADELEKIRKACSKDFQHNEISFLILLLMTHRKWKPKKIFEILNGSPDKRVQLFSKEDVDDPTHVKSLREFVTVGLPKTGCIFPKKYNTYLAQFKKRVKQILPDVNTANLSFNTIQRSLVR